MSGRHLKGPDERLEVINKDTTRHQEHLTRNTAKPDLYHPKGETHHYEENDDVDNHDDELDDSDDDDD